MLKGKEGESDRSDRICSRIVKRMTEQIWLPEQGDYRKVKREGE